MSAPHGTTPSGVFIFDSGGRLVAQTSLAATQVEGVASLADFQATIRSPDGTEFDLGFERAESAVVTTAGASRLAHVSVHRLTAAGDGKPDSPALAVVVSSARDETEATSMQRVLASVLAHELRTPLTTIFGGAQLIADGRVDAEARAQAATFVTREAQQLHRVVEDLLELVRGQDEAIETEPTLLQRSVPRIVSGIEFLRPDARIETSLAASLPPVMAAEPLLDQTLTNLIDHALAYVTPGGRVVIEASPAGAAVEVRVLDDGPGRDGHAAQGAFDLFHRSERTTADRSGANVPLAVSRRLVERMGGRIWAPERSDGGELVVSLPIANGRH